LGCEESFEEYEKGFSNLFLGIRTVKLGLVSKQQDSAGFGTGANEVIEEEIV
jgi:hypothetical protein